MQYKAENEAKASFDNIYTATTPHAYVEMMGQNSYEISEQVRPYFLSALELLQDTNGQDIPVQLLDIGCSYGMGAAFFKYGRSLDEMIHFFSDRAPRDYQSACQSTRTWLNVRPAAHEIRCVGLDSSNPAIHFATQSGLLDDGIVQNFEDPAVSPNAQEQSLLSHSNLIISTGAIGYITDATLGKIVPHLGTACQDKIGPFALLTILRMFDASPIQAVFEKHGYRLEKVEEVLLPQRRFTDENEEVSVLSLLKDKGLDTAGKEDQGKHFAELFIGARPDHFSQLSGKIAETHAILK